MKSQGDKRALESAFRDAHFQVECSGTSIVRRVGQIDRTADATLKAAGCCSHWAILTPCNPNARPLSSAENCGRLNALRDQLDALNLRYLPTINSAADGSWPEPGFCILDADTTLINDLAWQYTQLAYVSAALGNPPALIWTR